MKTKFPSDEAFHIIDSVGLPIDVFFDELRKTGHFLDIFEFVGICSKSANFTKPDRIRGMLVRNLSSAYLKLEEISKATELIDRVITFHYPDGLQDKKKRNQVPK